VLVQVVLHTEASHCHGGAVTLAGTNLIQLLVCETTRNVGAQGTFSEMVNSFNVGHTTVDVFAGNIGFQALVSTQADIQQYVVGDKITQAATNQSTVVQVTHAVGEIALRKGFHLNRTGALGHGRQRGSCNS